MNQLHQITIFSNGKVLITRQRGKGLYKFCYHVINPSKFVVKMGTLPYMQFACGRGYVFFVKKPTKG